MISRRKFIQLSSTAGTFLAIGFVVGGYLGSSLALKIDKDLLKKIFAVILFYTGFKMLEWDTAIIRFFKNLFS